MDCVADADIDTHANPICIDMSAHIDTHADDIGFITPTYKVVSVLLSALASKSQSLGLAVPGVRLPRPSWQGFEQCFCLGAYLALLGTGTQVPQARGHPVQLVKACILG